MTPPGCPVARRPVVSFDSSPEGSVRRRSLASAKDLLHRCEKIEPDERIHPAPGDECQSAENQCSIFCSVIVIVGELPAVLLYDTQKPAFG